MTPRPNYRPDAPTEETTPIASTRTPSGRELTASYSRNHGARALVLTSRDPRGAPQRLTLPARSLGWLRLALARIDDAGMLTGEVPEDDAVEGAPVVVVRRGPRFGRVSP